METDELSLEEIRQQLRWMFSTNGGCDRCSTMKACLEMSGCILESCKAGKSVSTMAE